MTFYKRLKGLGMQNSDEMNILWKQRLIQWRKEPSSVRVEKPIKLARARSLGYRAKEGIIIIRQRIPRGGKKRPKFGKRKSKRMGQRLVLSKNYQSIAEERVAKKYTNLEVLNSYFVIKDGKHAWYEVIMLDWANPSIRKDKKLKWIVNNRGRVFRGKTSIARKARGLRNKGKGAEKVRPSRRAVVRKKLNK